MSKLAENNTGVRTAHVTLAIRCFDVRGFRTIASSTASVTKGVRYIRSRPQCGFILNYPFSHNRWCRLANSLWLGMSLFGYLYYRVGPLLAHFHWLVHTLDACLTCLKILLWIFLVYVYFWASCSETHLNQKHFKAKLTGSCIFSFNAPPHLLKITKNNRFLKG